MRDCNKPTFTFPDNIYSATQVRLYGINLSPNIAYPGQAHSMNFGDIGISYQIQPTFDAATTKQIEQIAKGIDLSKGIFPDLPTSFPIAIIHNVCIDVGTFGTAFVATTTDLKMGNPLSCGLIYGYAYEGHCYDLAKPKVMIIPAFSQPIPTDDCGYDKKKDSNYFLWIVDKLDKCVEIEINQGFIEQIVLEANLPGRRSPSTYRATMALSHRAGRLTDQP